MTRPWWWDRVTSSYAAIEGFRVLSLLDGEYSSRWFQSTWRSGLRHIYSTSRYKMESLSSRMTLRYTADLALEIERRHGCATEASQSEARTCRVALPLN